MERHTQCLALTTSRAALSSPILSAGWRAHTSGRPASAEGGTTRPRCSLGDSYATGSKCCLIHIQASARGTDAERASRFEGPGG